MNAPGQSGDILARAAEARRQGRPEEARRLLEALVEREPQHPVALNSLGLLTLAASDAERAIHFLERAAAADPTAPPIWLNLAEAYRAAGRPDQEIESLNRALAIDAYLLPAMLRKAQALASAGRTAESADVYRALLAASPDSDALPAPVRQALARGREVVRFDDERRAAAMSGPLAAVYAAYPGADFQRAQAYAEHRAGRRKVYQQEPTGGHFPFLPAIEFFDRQCFAWLETLERATPAITRELLSLWDAGDDGFVPYVEFDPTQPVNQWAELNHSPRWSAWFFWKDSVRHEDNCARCPATAAALAAIPMLDIPGKGPTAMFSILQPRTRIPPHTGTSNVRTTIHLPLVVPGGCGFRVGAETRAWRVGEAWAFDDTIEHEAWNDSDRPRAILIVDTWNPLLTESERAVVRAIG